MKNILNYYYHYDDVIVVECGNVVNYGYDVDDVVGYDVLAYVDDVGVDFMIMALMILIMMMILIIMMMMMMMTFIMLMMMLMLRLNFVEASVLRRKMLCCLEFRLIFLYVCVDG